MVASDYLSARYSLKDRTVSVSAWRSVVPKRQPLRPDASDAELFAALQAGQTEALAVLYDRHASLVYGLACQLLQRVGEAEDLTQDIFLALSRSTYDPRRGSLRTFLTVLTRSRCLDRLRSRQRRFQFWQKQTPPAPPEDTTWRAAIAQEQQAVVREALATLPEPQQTVLNLAYFEGLSQSEIAEQLQLPLGTVKARARRGLLRLRQYLEAQA